MEKSIGLEILKWLNKTRLIIYSVLILNAIVVLAYDINIKFFLGLTGIILKPLGIDSPFLDSSTTILTMIGYYLIPICAIYLQNVFIRKKIKLGFYIVVAVDILLTAFSGLSILSPLILLLVVPKSSSNFFNKEVIIDEARTSKLS